MFIETVVSVKKKKKGFWYRLKAYRGKWIIHFII
ncbi:hypothetical protein NC653_026035 [Populus alba x Populus x berolinensis]|uniref:Uncharacterized protein n=1 Tax=Populus alba x Populus x berolinensis TaxID=444605 RepID=A0AAD6Q8F5_9ROSI|nr:hypothetical protein NC653_026035 [Populus alba x Populus x berolinensis]